MFISRVLAAALLTASPMLSGLVEAQQTPEKPYVCTLLTAQVWPSGYSEVRALGSAGPSIITNFDVTVFDPGLSLETADTTYGFLILPARLSAAEVRQGQMDGTFDGRGLPGAWPQQLPAPGGNAQYVVRAGTPGSVLSSSERRAFDLLHQYYRANRVALVERARQREIEQEKATAAEAARRASIPLYSGPPVLFQRVERPASSKSGARP